ncbi:hypothetical protein B0181_02890 [Moraxella caviae]|uniref:Uncharacterized protein n=1 Tax=Moraxella caviae TaxID=34060 RepID=A0A1T0A7F0_9GAMM|nr:hypothetical protein [Moraxella caviae]OOR91518.1 hypothetical protein B0181_02890 [Moraxella caviae]STZ14394.1 Uncharacterised protein [Moraxella caviae]VEW10519.1 Uncharacterised protein [Moraxella caviae]
MTTMTTKITAFTAAALACLSLAAPAAAKDKTPTLSEKEQAMLNVCEITTIGAASIAHLRQTNVSYADAKKQVELSGKELKQHFGDNGLSKSVHDAWKDALAQIYKLDVEKTDDKKAAFIASIADQTMHGCLNELSSQLDK